MGTRERLQKEKSRLAARSADLSVLIAIVNEGRFVFPHAYVPKHGRTVTLEFPLVFDANLHELHREVRDAACANVDGLVVSASMGRS
ncbi:MAG TPA: hypothetical protein VM032_13380, partial [Vicinamibacterales bacterium]|nr:hypothetical protein [Vicinamibacterales bacterium]